MVDEQRIDISVVIVSWNVRDLLLECLESFVRVAGVVINSNEKLGQLGDRMVDFWVVDNASTDGTADAVAQRYRWVHLVASERNLGFSAGNNLALRQCSGRAVLLLNPDTVLTTGIDGRDALTAMADVLESDASVGLIGPRLVYGDGSPQSSARRFPNLRMALMESTLLERWFPGNRWARRYRCEDRSLETETEVDWVTGACMLVRRDALDQVGHFDQRFFMYSEELDLCKRLRSAGWRVLFLPQATVIHYEGKSSEQISTRRQMLFDRSKVQYFYKHHGACASTTLRLFLLSTYGLSLLMEALKWLLGHKRSLRAQRIASYRELIHTRLLIKEDG